MKNQKEIEYWKTAWQDDKMDFSACEIFWDKRAQAFNESVNSKNQEATELIKSLTDKKIIDSSSAILDIGCGPGSYTLPLAQNSQEVYAMDISKNMLTHLQKNANQQGIDNIQTFKENWDDVDLVQKQWDKKFDLVFASMSPAIHDFHTLKKMTDASKGYCYLSGFVSRKDEIGDALQQQLTSSKGISSILENKIYYTFNILWNLGYYPEVTYLERNWENTLSLEEAIDNYTHKLLIRSDLTEQEKEKIKEFLVKLEVEGKIIEKTEAVIGIVTWKV